MDSAVLLSTPYFFSESLFFKKLIICKESNAESNFFPGPNFPANCSFVLSLLMTSLTSVCSPFRSIFISRYKLIPSFSLYLPGFTFLYLSSLQARSNPSADMNWLNFNSSFTPARVSPFFI